MNWQWTPLALVYLLVAIIPGAAAYAAWQRRETEGALYLAVALAAVAWWAAMDMFDALATGLQAKVTFGKLSHIAIQPAPVFFVLFVLAYTGRRHWITHRMVALLSVIPAITLLLVLTNDWHRQIWPQVTLAETPLGVLSVYQHTPWFWLVTSYDLGLLLAASGLLLAASGETLGVYRWQNALMAAFIGVPVIGQMVLVAAGDPLPFVDWPVIGYALGGLLVGGALYRFALFDLVPVARSVLVENMQDAVLVIDPQQRIADINLAARRLFPGNTAAPGDTVDKLLPILPELGACLAGAGTAQAAVTVDGEVRSLELRSTLLHGQHGSTRGEMVVMRDITAIKEYERMLQEANAALEQRVAERTEELAAALADLKSAAQLKDEFLAAVSHELRTPLTGILGLADALASQAAGELNERQLRYTAGIRESGDRLLGMVNSILRYTNLLSGRVAFQRNLCRLGELGAIAVRSVRPRAQQKQQTIDFSVDPLGLEMIGDDDAIIQLLQQLLDNAVKFTPEGGCIGLDMRGDAEAAQIRLVVWDTGIGIAPEQQAAMFQAFVQGDGRLGRAYGGVGLGMAYVRRVVELLGGTIGVESKLGHGSRFTVTLPAG